MNKHTQQFLGKMAVWLIAEIVLNLAGLDDLANVSEFVFDQSSTPVTQQVLHLDTRLHHHTEISALLA